ncbi:Transmembrane and coiled-coil domain-containing protein 4 [Linderina pennispora]|nr:Transmembrane and coiled-coil domain-containing protein 4 [Linderina pennispora]
MAWLQVPEPDRQDLATLPYGESANDMILHMLRCKRADEEAVEKDKKATPSASLAIATTPDTLYSGLILTCLGISDNQLQVLGEQAQEDAQETAQKGMLRPFEYDSRSRAVAFVISEWLDMPRQFINTYERKLSQELEQAVTDSMKLENAGATALETEKNRKWGWKKYLATGAGVAIAGTLVGVTAGLAAPLIVAGLGAVGVGGLGFLATAGGAAMVGSLLGVAGGGLVGKRFNTRLRGLHEFYFMQLRAVNRDATHSGALHATIFVPGFLQAGATRSPFAPIGDVMGLDVGDAYTLYFETKELMELENAVSQFVENTAKGAATTLVLQQTVLHVLVGAFTWPLAILKVSQIIDTPWSVGLVRAKRAGKMMAEVLQKRAHGNRPVTLVGYSLGALAIFTCLQELHKHKAHGIVDTVVLLGMPADGSDKKAWSACCHAVARRVIVGYSNKDWILAFLLRASSFCTHLAGLTGVDSEKLFPDNKLVQRKITNVDLSGIVARHLDYLYSIDDIMLEMSRVL